MTEQPIVQVGNPVLRKISNLVKHSSIQTPEIQELIDRMIETMRAAPGVGLAAPQIGVDQAIFVMEDGPTLYSHLNDSDLEERKRVKLPLTICINPEILTMGNTAEFYEGCLSLSGYLATVRRPLEIVVGYLDQNGEKQRLELSGWPARIVQHEFDHLRGVLYIDRADLRTLTTTENYQEFVN